MNCSIEGCSGRRYSRGWCQMHYERWYRHGDVNYQPPTAEQRFWTKVAKGTDDECWLWQGALTTTGYGSFKAAGWPGGAHRISYLLLVGPVPEGLVLDHLCRVRNCVNPAHLEPVTSAENTARGLKAKRTHCMRGHLFTEESTIVRTDGRTCRICQRTVRSPEAVRRARERRQAARGAVVQEFLADEMRPPAIA